MNSIIEAQIELEEQQALQIEKDFLNRTGLRFIPLRKKITDHMYQIHKSLNKKKGDMVKFEYDKVYGVRLTEID